MFMNEWVWDPGWDEENPMAVQLICAIHKGVLCHPQT